MSGPLHGGGHPILVVVPCRIRSFPFGMKTHKHRLIVFAARNASGDAFRHTAPDNFNSVRRTIAPKNPDHALVPEPLAKELSVCESVSRVELGVFRRTRILHDPTAPSRQQPDV